MAKRSNVIVMVVDGLRADHLGCYGYAAAATPALDALAAAGCRAQSCFTPATAAPAAWAALLTGMHPVSLGMTAPDGGRQLPLGMAVLADPFLRAGYSTCCFDNLRRRFHWFGEGFEQYVDPGVGQQSGASACRMADRAIPWLRTHRDEPILLWIRFTDLVGSAPEKYDTELRALDGQIGRMLKALDDLRLGNDAIVAVVGSYGWSLGEHGLWGASGLHDGTLRVPLLVRSPGVAGGQVLETEIGTYDLGPSLLEAAGFEAPPSLDGRSFWPGMRGGSLTPRPSLPAYDGSDPSRWSLRRDGATIVVNRSPDGQYRAALESAGWPDTAGSLERELQEWVDRRLADWASMAELLEDI